MSGPLSPVSSDSFPPAREGEHHNDDELSLLNTKGPAPEETVDTDLLSFIKDREG